MASRRQFRRFLSLPLIALFGIAALALFAACSPEANAEMQTYTGINAIRQQNGLPPLRPDSQSRART